MAPWLRTPFKVPSECLIDLCSEGQRMLSNEDNNQRMLPFLSLLLFLLLLHHSKFAHKEAETQPRRRQFLI